MSCVAFFGIGIVVHCRRERFRQQPRVPGYGPVLSVAERAAVGMMELRAGKRLKMATDAQDRVETFIFVFDKNHVLDFFGSLSPADRYDAAIARLDLCDIVVIDAAFSRLDLVESHLLHGPENKI